MVESIKFPVSAPAGALTGLERVRDLLREVNTYMALITSKGFSIPAPAFKAADIEKRLNEVLGKASNIRGKLATTLVGDAFGKDLGSAFAREFKKFQKEIPQAFSGTRFSSVSGAAGVLEPFFKSINEAQGKQAEAFRKVFSGGGAPAAPTATQVAATAQLAPGGVIPLIIPPDRIQAVLGQGQVPIVGGAPSGSAPPASSVSGARRNSRGIASLNLDAAGLATGESVPEIEGEIRRKLKQTEKSFTTLVDRYVNQTEKVSETFDAEGKTILQRTTTLDKSRAAIVRLSQAFADFRGNITGVAGDSPTRTRDQAAAARFGANQFAALLSQEAPGLEAAGFGQQVAQFRQKLARLTAAAESMEQAVRAEAIRSTQGLARVTDRAATATAKREEAEAAAAAAAERLARQTTARETQLSRVLQRANDIQSELRAQGFTPRTVGERQRFGPSGQRERQSTVFERTVGDQRERVNFTQIYQAGRLVDVQMDRTASRIAKATEETKRFSQNIVDNTIKVTQWATAVSILYGSVNAARFALDSLAKTGFQARRLSVVFRGEGESARGLTQDVLRLAATENRAADEALEASISWARLGLSRRQVGEATRVSLVAANVAEVDAATATRQLSAIYQAYNLDVRDLAGVLGQLNQVSNTYNVTNKDLLEGISRVSSAAKAAGLPLNELIGLIGAGVGGTGQTGAQISTAIKSTIGALSNPELQKQLERNFGLAVTGADGEVKTFSETLGDLFTKYNQVTKEEQKQLLFFVGGKTQLSRLAAVLDSYLEGMALAISAQLNLNSAESENSKIKETLSLQIQGVRAQLERFVSIQGNRGPAQALSFFAETAKNVIGVLNAPGINTGLSVFAAGLTVLGARAAVATLRMAALAKEPGAIGQSIRGVTSLWQNFTKSLAESAKFFASGPSRLVSGIRSGSILDPARRGIAKFGDTLESDRFGPVAAGISRLQATAVAAGGIIKTVFRGIAAALGEVGAILAIVTLGSYAFNKAWEAIGQSSQSAEKAMLGFNEQASQTAARAQAAADAVKLLDRVAKTLPGVTDSQRREKLVGSLGALGGGLGITKEESEALKNANSPAAVNAAVAGTRARLIQQSAIDRQNAIIAQEKALARAQDERQRLADSPFSNPDLMVQAQNEVLRLSLQIAQARAEEADEAEAAITGDERRANLLKAQNEFLEAQSQIYRQLSTGGDAVGAARNRESQLKSELSLLQKQTSAAEARIAVDRSQQGSKLARADELQRQAAEIRRAAGEVQVPGGGAEPGFEIGQMQERIRLIGQADKLEGEARALRAATTTQEISDAQRVLSVNRELATQKEEEIRRLRQQMPLLEAASRIELSRRLAESDSSQFDVGSNDSERIQNRILGLQELRLEAMREAAQLNGDEVSRMEALARAAEYLNQIQDAHVEQWARGNKLASENNNLLRERRREFERSFLGAGPEEMLRKLAAVQLTSGGRNLSGGQFFALGPQMRQEILGLPGFGDQEARLREEMGFRQQIPGANDRAATQRAITGARNENNQVVARLSELLEPLQRNFANLVGQAAAAAAEFVNVAGAAGALRTAFNQLETAAMAAASRMGSVAEGTRSQFVPFNPQTSGVQAGFGG